MTSVKQLFVSLALGATFLAVPGLAQQSDKAILQTCLQAQAEEFLPLAEARDAVYQKFTNRTAAIRSISLWLEDDCATANAKRKKEIAALETRLKTLKENANLTSDDATKNLAATLETIKGLSEEITDEQEIAIKPFSRKLSALQRHYEPQETILKPVIKKLFRDNGNSKTTEDLIKSYDSFSFSSGTSSGTYRRTGENTSTAICYIYLVNEKVGKKKYGMFNEKYPVAYRSRNQLEILVGQARVTIYSSDRNVLEDGLDETLASLVDIEKLAAMLAP